MLPINKFFKNNSNEKMKILFPVISAFFALQTLSSVAKRQEIVTIFHFLFSCANISVLVFRVAENQLCLF